MCSIQQQHLNPSVKPPYSGTSMKQSYDTGLHPQMHPYMQKESQLPTYMQKEMQYTQQCFQKFNMQPPQYGNNYVPESNSFLATLSKINPRMAQSIINDPHIREASMGYPQEQNLNYAHAQRLYSNQPPMHTSPGYQGGHRNPPQGYSCAQQYGYKPPSDGYNRLPQYQTANYEIGKATHDLSPRHNIPMPMNYAAVPQKISPNYPQCAQLEYSQHYQHRRYQMPPDYYPQSYKSSYLQNQDLPPVVAAETAVPSARMKQFWESWGEGEIETIPEAATSEQETKRKEERPPEQLYVLGTTEIAKDSLGQYVQLEALPENMRELYENGSIIIKAATENSIQDMEVVASTSSNRINILDHKRIIPGSTTPVAEQVVNLHIVETPDASQSISNPQTGDEKSLWFVETVVADGEKKASPKSMPTISDMFEEVVAPEQVARSENQSDVCQTTVVEENQEGGKECDGGGGGEEGDFSRTVETTKDSITDSFKTELDDKTNIPEEEGGSKSEKMMEGCSVIVSRRKTIEEIVQKITFKKNCEEKEQESKAEDEIEPKENCVADESQGHLEEVCKEIELIQTEDQAEKDSEVKGPMKTNPDLEDASRILDGAYEESESAMTIPQVNESSCEFKSREEDEPLTVTTDALKDVEVDGTKEQDEAPIQESESVEMQDDFVAGQVENASTTGESEGLTKECEPCKIDAFKLENNNVLIHLDGALVEIKVSSEGKKKIITVVPYCVDSDSEASEEVEIEEEAEQDVPSEDLDIKNELLEDLLQTPSEAALDVLEESKDKEVESVVEETIMETSESIEEIAETELANQEEVVADDAIEDKAVVLPEIELAEMENDLHEVVEVDQLLAEVETEEHQQDEVEVVTEENRVEPELEQEVVPSEPKENAVAQMEVNEVIETSPFTKRQNHQVNVEEIYPQTTLEDVELPKEVEVADMTEAADRQKPLEDENALFEPDVSAEVIIGSPTSVDKIEIEEVVADSTQSSIAEVQTLPLPTKASRKHFSDDDMLVKTEVQTKLARKRKKELKTRRVTIAEDSPKVINDEDGVVAKKMRFSSGKSRLPMINSSNNEGSMREQVEEATFEERMLKRRRSKVEDRPKVEKEFILMDNGTVKNYFAIDLTKNRSKHHYRPVKPDRPQKELHECEVTTTTKTVEDKIEALPPTKPSDVQTKTDESEVTSSTKVVVNVKSYISRSVSEDSSDCISQKKRLTLEEYTNRKKRLNSSASVPAIEVPSESQEILNAFTKKLLQPTVEKKVIDIDEFDIPTRSQELDEIRRSPSYTKENPETITFQPELDFKLNFQLPSRLDLIKQKQIERNDLLMRRFLNNEKLTEDEMQKVKEIIHCKRMLVEMNKLRMEKLASEGHKSNIYQRLNPNSNLKLRLKKISKPRKRFRNLYGDSSSSESDEQVASAQLMNRDPRINRRLHEESSMESDYLAYQTKVKNGVPKIIIKRRLPNLMQPYVKLERSPHIDLLASKRRRVC